MMLALLEYTTSLFNKALTSSLAVIQPMTNYKSNIRTTKGRYKMGNAKLHTLRWLSKWHYPCAYVHTVVSAQMFEHMGMVALLSVLNFA